MDIGPIRWIKDSDGKMIMAAMESRDGERRGIQVGILKEGYSLVWTKSRHTFARWIPFRRKMFSVLYAE